MSEKVVKIIECPRDAWQGLPRQIPAARKAEYLKALIEAGFHHLDAVSFVSPRAVPQMADSEEVLSRLAPAPEVEIIGIVVNEQGAERAVATSVVNTLGFPTSISATFLRKNQNQSTAENEAVLEAVWERARSAGLSTVAYISMAFGNPYGDEWSVEHVIERAAKIARLGIPAISLADTVGMAEPDLIASVLKAVTRQDLECEVGVHLHSTPESAGAKVLAAIDAGCRRIDAAVGGLGGCPFAQDEMVGNIPTEEVFRALRERGFEVPLRLEQVQSLNRAISAEFTA